MDCHTVELVNVSSYHVSIDRDRPIDQIYRDRAVCAIRASFCSSLSLFDTFCIILSRECQCSFAS